MARPPEAPVTADPDPETAAPPPLGEDDRVSILLVDDRPDKLLALEAILGDLGQKMVLAEVMWGVVLADGEIATHEGWLLRKLAHLLELEPGYLAEARKAAADGKRA